MGKINDKMDDRAKEYMSVCTTMVPIRVHLQPTLYLENFPYLWMEQNLLTCINQNILYEILYGKRKLKYWYKKDNVFQDQEDIMWEDLD